LTLTPAEPEVGWHLTVDPACDGWRVDRFLALRLARVSRARAARLSVYDEDAPERGPLKKSAAVRKGQRLFARRPLPDEGADEALSPPQLVHVDDELIVVDKPPGWAAHPTATRHAATLTSWLQRAGFGGEAEPIHRLDVETSGLVAVARTTAAARWYKGALAERAFEKTYLAVVVGSPPVEVFTLDRPLGFDPHSTVRLKMGPGELASETRCTVLWRAPGHTVVQAEPLTGRQHQIRVHLAMAGTPVVGDKLYGPDEGLFLVSLERDLTADELARLGHPRHALHAWRLSIPRPGGAVSRFEAAWPADLAALAPGFEAAPR
jgi:23S rRNA pseudouridine1911/1915/1917 synthase